MMLTINGRTVSFEGDPTTPLLWVLRDQFGLKGTKFSCGAGLCGACTVIVDGSTMRSCLVRSDAVEGAEITTIEGLADENGKLTPVQQAWKDISVPQCGYCQSGFIMAVTRLLDDTPDPTDQDIEDAITNLCRCGTYDRVRKAIRKAIELRKED